MLNGYKSNEWLGNLALKTFKIEMQKGGTNNPDILQNWVPLKIRSPLFSFLKFEASDKSTPESCRMDWNLMQDAKLRYLKLLKLQYRTGDQIIQAFPKIGSPQKLHHCFLICRNLKTLRKVVLDHTQCIEIKWMTTNMGP